MGNCLNSERKGKDGGGQVPFEECLLPGGGGDAEHDQAQEQIVRRINEELAEFREQLKKSQEMFHTMNNSAQNVSQSCPVLVDEERGKSKLVTCSTQTEAMTVMPLLPSAKSGGSISSLRFSSPLPPDDFLEDPDIANIYENMSLDDDTGRFAINLSTVLEESLDQEPEPSPSSLQKRMNSERRSRHKLVKMANTLEDELERLGPLPGPGVADDVKSDTTETDYKSAASSLPPSSNTSNYGSLERPLVCGLCGPSLPNGSPDQDTCSTISNTTFGSPMLSSPSSLAYWTPMEGSSSQDTITVPDGEKTPVNEDWTRDGGVSAEEGGSDLRPGLRSSGRVSGGAGGSGGTESALDQRQNHCSIGVIPDADLDRMKRNAIDVVARHCDESAKVLELHEWRTLRCDLNKKENAEFRKQNRDEDGGDIEEACFPGGSRNVDLDEEAEQYCELFPFPDLAETLFKSLDHLKSNSTPCEADLTTLSAQFEQLSLVFKTNHVNLETRAETVSRKHQHSQKRVKEIYACWTDNVRKLRDEKGQKGEDLHQILNTMDDCCTELEIHSHALSSTARSAGLMDYDLRAYKMIEVMVLYVHIMKNLRDKEQHELQVAREVLAEHGIGLGESPLHCAKPGGKCVPGAQHHTPTASTASTHNNNNDKIQLDSGSGQGDGAKDPIERCADGRPRYKLQLLLERKKSCADGEERSSLLRDKEHRQSTLLKYVSDTYEVWRGELDWPWTWDQTWKGIKQGFSVFIMLIGLVIVIGNLIPNVVGAPGREGQCETVISRFLSLFPHAPPPTHSKLPHF